MVDRAYRKTLARLVAASPTARAARRDALRRLQRFFPVHLGPLAISFRDPRLTPARESYDTAWGWCWWRFDHVVGPFWWRTEE